MSSPTNRPSYHFAVREAMEVERLRNWLEEDMNSPTNRPSCRFAVREATEVERLKNWLKESLPCNQEEIEPRAIGPKIAGSSKKRKQEEMNSDDLKVLYFKKGKQDLKEREIKPRASTSNDFSLFSEEERLSSSKQGDLQPAAGLNGWIKFHTEARNWIPPETRNWNSH